MEGDSVFRVLSIITNQERDESYKPFLSKFYFLFAWLCLKTGEFIFILEYIRNSFQIKLFIKLVN